jgi:uncharacterized protein
MVKTNAVNWFEIPVSDFNRAKEFYETILNFTMREHEGGATRMGFFEYDMEDEGAGGAIVYDPEFYTPSANGSLIYLNCEPEIQIVLDRIVSAGGKILQGRTSVSATQDLGYWALMLDSEGNRIALHAME